MIEHIKTALRDLQRLHLLYGTTLGLLLLGILATVTPIGATAKIFSRDVNPERYSLIVGVLFGLFALAVLLKTRQLQNLLKVACQEKDIEGITCELRYYPWLFSPFQESIAGKRMFWASLWAGFAFVGALGLLHICDLYGRGPCHQMIGLIDLVILAFTLPVFWNLARILKELETLIQGIQSKGAANGT